MLRISSFWRGSFLSGILWGGIVLPLYGTPPRFAKGFTVETTPCGYLLTVYGIKTTNTYHLCKNPPYPSEGRIVSVPVRRIFLLTTTVVPALVELNGEEKIIGVQEGRWIEYPSLREKIKRGKIRSLKGDVDLERIVALNPDLILSYEMGDPRWDREKEWKRTGKTVLYIQDYREDTPLGRAEWMKVISYLLDKERGGDLLFSSIYERYERVKKSTLPLPKGPVVIATPYEGIWYLPGEFSYVNKLLSDGGGEVVLTGRSGAPEDPEKVALALKKGEVWFILGHNSENFRWIYSDPRLKDLPPIKKRKVFQLYGGRFWERGVLHPDEVVEEIYRILHKNEKGGFYFSPVSER